MKQFYIYIHCRPDGEPFYVGKGHSISNRKGRAYQLYEEGNKYYGNIVSKYGKKNILIHVYNCESEWHSFRHEEWMIAWCRAQGFNMTNMTDGGEGISGYKHTKEMCAAIAKITRTQWTPERRAAATKRMIGKQRAVGFKHTPEWLIFHSQRLQGNKNVKGHVWITNGNEEKTIFKTEKLPNGFKYGRSPSLIIKMSKVDHSHLHTLESSKKSALTRLGKSRGNYKRKEIVNGL